jgi:hypothetical protein
MKPIKSKGQELFHRWRFKQSNTEINKKVHSEDKRIVSVTGD